MVLGELPVPGHPTYLDNIGYGPNMLEIGAGGGCYDIYTLIYH